MKKYLIRFYDTIVCALAMFFAILLRFNDFTVEGAQALFERFFVLILVAFLVKVFIFTAMKVSRGLWRFTSIPDLKVIVIGALAAEIVTVFAMFILVRAEFIPRSIFIIDWMLTVYLLGGARLGYRLYRERKNLRVGKSTIVIGAGSVAEKLLRDYQRGKFDFSIIGLLDDQNAKIGRTILGYKILGPVDLLPEIIKKHKIEKVVIAIPSLKSPQIRKIVSLINSPLIELVTLPSFQDIVEGKVSISQLRPVDVNDLLGRDPVQLNVQLLAPMIQGKKILVTGAGGSIGSELVRQIARLSPQELILFDNNEFFLYELERDLKENFFNLNYRLIIGDIRDKGRLEKVFKDFSPEICYHAAAYKHVPLMEDNPHEAIKTNIYGTKNLLDVSKNNSLKKLIFVSTDKAVRPTSVMGATKKITEMMCQVYASTQNSFEIVVVRFGNVLASHGSVVPLFVDQIKSGGPVTITHKEMTRYFMSILEASQLVLNAGAIGKSGNIMILDMGEPVKILDLAKQLIQLSGFEPGVDIEIKEIGIRPGEKLYEELFYDAEKMMDTSIDKVKISKYHEISQNFLADLVAFESTYLSLNNSEIRKALAHVISNEVEDIQKYLQ